MRPLLRSLRPTALPALALHFLNQSVFRATGKTWFPTIPVALHSGTIRLSPGGNDGLNFWIEVAQTHSYDSLIEPLRRGHWLIDCGANTGAVSVQYLRQCPQARGLALEPHPATFPKLCANLEANGLTGRVTPMNRAVGASDGQLAFTISEHSSMGFATTDGVDIALGKRTEITVPVVSLDSLVASLTDAPEWFALKIDVEGHELRVLEGASRALRRASHVVMEAHSGQLREACARVLREQGFVVRSDKGLLCADNPAAGLARA